MQAPFSSDEATRIEALRQYDVLDTLPEQEFDDLTHLAAQICGTPISLITLVDEERQWFKSRVGLAIPEIPRAVSFCAHAITGNDILLVPDASADERFADNPLVTAEPHLRFYAGVPLVTPEGQAVGTLCVIDTVPRQLDQTQQDALIRLGRQAVALLEARPDSKTEKGQSQQARQQAELQRLAIESEKTRQDADRLKASETRYRRLFEAAKDGILILDAESGKIEDANPYLCELLGFAEEDFLGKQLWEIGAFRDKADNQAALLILQTEGYIRYDDLPLMTRDGKQVNVEFVSNVYEVGNQRVIQCNIRDITERKRGEAELRASEMHKAAIFEVALDCIISMDDAGYVIEWNSAAEKTFGYTREKAIGQLLSDLIIPPALRAQHHRGLAHLLATGEGPFINRRVEVSAMRADGSEFPAELAISRVHLGERSIFTGYLRDITDRHQAAATERESQRFLQATLDALSSHLAVLDEDGKIIAVNQAWRQFSEENEGTAASCGVGANYIEVCDQAEGAWSQEAPSVAQGIRDVMVSRQQGFCLEYPCHSPNEERTFNLCVTRFVGEGPVRVVVAHENITARRQAEQALEVTAHEIVTIWESMTDAFFSIDTQWRFTRINTHAARIWHRNAEELIGKNIWEEFPAAVGLKFYTEYHRAVEEQVMVNFEEFYAPHNAWREVHAYPSSIGLSVYFRDITERKRSEEALYLSQERFEILSRATNDTIWDWNLLTDEVWWNESFQAHFGYNRQDVEPGMDSWKRRIHPDDVERVSVAIHAVIENGQQFWSDEYRFRRADGSYAAILDRGFIIHDGENHPVRMIGSMQDITARKHAENALRASEERFRAFMDNTPARVFMKDRDGRYVYLNKAVEQFRRTPASELMGQTGYDRLAIEIAEPLHRNDLQVFNSGQPQQFEEVVTSFDGRLHHEIVAKFLLPDGNGQQLLAGVAVDVTQQKQAESERDRFFTLSLDMLAIVGNDGYMKRLNPAFEATLGFSNAELMAVPFLEFVHPDDHSTTLEEMARLKSGSRAMRFENRYRCRDGSYKWLRWMCAPFEELFYCVAHDITSVKQAGADLLKANDELEVRVEERTAQLQAQILERERAEQEVRAQARQHEAVANLGRRALLDLDLDTLLQGTVALVSATLEVDICTFWEHLPESDTLQRRVGVGLSSEEMESNAKINVGDAFQIGYTALLNETVISEDPEQETRFRSIPLLVNKGVTCTITVPVYDGALYGVLGACSSHKQKFSQNEIYFLQTVANVLASAIARKQAQVRNIQLNATLQAANDELRANEAHLLHGNQISTDLMRLRVKTSDELQKALHQITEAAGTMLDIERSSVWLFNEDRSIMRCHDLYERGAHRHSKGLELAADAHYFPAIKAQREVVSDDAQTNPVTRDFAETYLNPNGITSILDVALVVGGKHIGVLCAEHIGEPRQWQAEDRIFASAVASVCSLVLESYERTRVETALHEAYEALRVEVIERKMALETLHQVAEAFRATQEMLQTVMNHIPQAIFWKDRQGIYLGCNNRMALDAGFGSPDEVPGKSDFDMPWAEFAEGYRADDAQVMDTNTPKLNIEEPLVKADGSRVWLRTNKIPLHDDDGAVVGVLASYEDITPQKEAEAAIHQAREEAEAANQAKSEFLSRMSHELRTPLNAILGFGQILDKQDLAPLSKESVGYILKGGRHLLDLINEVLDIARVEAGHIGLSLEPIALDDVVPEACALVRLLAAERNIHIRFDQITAELGRQHVLADRQRLKQVIINLLANAIKYNREGGEVEVSCDHKADGWSSIAVRDTGPGISPQDLSKLFMPFERLNAATSEIEGTGLGLVLSQRLVTAMGGTLNVESTLGQGATFTIELPQAISPEEQLANLPYMEPLAHARQESGRTYIVLCIEDNLSNLRLLEVIFQGRPEITLLAAMQGSVGLDLARQHEPDLILLDLNLPDIHGSEVLARLQQSALTRDIPVIVISADATPNQVERLLTAGARSFLTKPLDVGQFLQTLDEFLQVPSATTENNMNFAK